MATFRAKIGWLLSLTIPDYDDLPETEQNRHLWLSEFIYDQGYREGLEDATKTRGQEIEPTPISS
jgi:hypothetical protein